jgi:predicted nucleic acid-binding protein
MTSKIQLLNTNRLLKEIRRIIKEEIQKELPKNQIDSFWKHLNILQEKIKILEKKLK